MTPLIFIKLELSSIDVHVVEEELLISCSDTNLILCKGLTSSCGLLVDCIVHTEGVHFPVE